MHINKSTSAEETWVLHDLFVGTLKNAAKHIDRELARFIYVREVKRFDPFKFSIYAWYIKIAIAGSLTPVRLAWVPFLRVPKNGFIYVEADTKKLYAGL